jgi:hypothetical protein
MVLAGHRSGRSTSPIYNYNLNIILNDGNHSTIVRACITKPLCVFVNTCTRSTRSIEPFELPEHPELCDTIRPDGDENLNDNHDFLRKTL